jgi:hypothetical protein
MAIRNAADYEKAVVSEAKLQVAFEVMNRYLQLSTCGMFYWALFNNSNRRKVVCRPAKVGMFNLDYV